MRILIRDLSRQTTEKQLQELFEAYGPVQSTTIVMDDKTGNSKGFGFVEMPKAGDAKAAIFNLNRHEVDGARIRVKRAKS